MKLGLTSANLSEYLESHGNLTEKIKNRRNMLVKITKCRHFSQQQKSICIQIDITTKWKKLRG